MVLTGIEHNLIGGAIVTISLLGVLFNWKLYRKTRKEFDSNVLVLNLIFTNVAIIYITFPLPTISSFNHYWVFSNYLCSFYAVSSLIFGFVMMLSIVMICLDMLLMRKYESYVMNKSKTRSYMIGFMWANSFFFGMAPLFGWSRINVEPSGTSCTLDWSEPDMLYTTHIIACFMFMFVVPIIVMLYCICTKQSETQRRESSVNKSIMCLISLFIFAWTPYAICYLYPLIGHASDIPLRFSAIAPLFGKFSVITVPLALLGFYKEKAEETSQKENLLKCQE